MDEILKHFEIQAQENVAINCDKQRKKHISVSSNSDSHIPLFFVNWIPANSEQEENLKHIQVHRNRGKPDENTNTYTHYEQIFKKPNRLTYH